MSLKWKIEAEREAEKEVAEAWEEVAGEDVAGEEVAGVEVVGKW